MSEVAALPPSGPVRPPRPSPRKRGRKIALWVVFAFVLIVAALATAINYAVRYDSGTQFLLRAAMALTPGKLSMVHVGGNLAHGLQLKDVSYRNGKIAVDIDRLDGDWSYDWRARRLEVAHLHAGAIRIIAAPSPSTPATLPQDLTLPLALTLNDVRVRQFTYREGSTFVELQDLALHGTSDGRKHELNVEKLGTPYGAAAGDMRLDGRRPFALDGNLQLTGVYRHAVKTVEPAKPAQTSGEEAWRLAAKLSGSLETLDVALDASGDKMQGQARIAATPFAALPFLRAGIDVRHVNPQVFDPSAPQADLALHADLQPLPAAAGTPLTVGGRITLDNAMPGPLDRQRLPVISASADVRLDAATQQIANLQVRVSGNGTLTGGGNLRDGNGTFNLEVAGLDLNAIHAAMSPSRLHGPLAVKLLPQRQEIALQLDDKSLQIKLNAAAETERFTFTATQFESGQPRLELGGHMGRTGDMPYALKGKLSRFNPAAWVSSAPVNSVRKSAGKNPSAALQADINMEFSADGKLMPPTPANTNPQPLLHLAFNIGNSTYDGLPMTGSGDVRMEGLHLLPSRADLLIAGNRLRLDGSFGAPADQLAVNINAPQLQRLGFGLSGLLLVDGKLGGSRDKPTLRATYRAEQLVFGERKLAKLSGQADLQAALQGGVMSPADKLALTVHAQGYRGPEATLANLDADLSGTYAAHKLTLSATGEREGKPLALTMAAQGRAANDSGVWSWKGTLQKLENRGWPRVLLDAPLAISAAPDRLTLGATRLSLVDAAIDLKSFDYDHGSIRSAGAISHLNVGSVLALLQQFNGTTVPLQSDLVLDGRWDFALAANGSGYVQIDRKSGDVSFPIDGRNVALGLSQARLRAELRGAQITADASIAASRIGTLNAKAQSTLSMQGNVPTLTAQTPLTGSAELDVTQVRGIGNLLGPQYSLDGKLAARLQARGTIGAPLLSGTVNGDALSVTLFDQGIHLQNGTVRLALDNNVIDLRQFEFHGGDGTLRASGKVQLGRANPDLNATITADKLQLFASPERQLILSGQATLANTDDKMRIDGKVRIDRALFDYPKSSAPRLSDDVVVLRNDGKIKSFAAPTEQQKFDAAANKPAAGFSPAINIAVDFGDNFRFRGKGADLRLAGEMTVSSAPYSPLRATGTINVVDGTYEAFGTRLAIERGIINFQGPLNNPNINILAMKRNQEVEAGVEITGTPEVPRVRLVSTPSVADEEKLSWIMFGHGSDSSGLGQINASSQALALLGNYGGKKLARGIGLDEFSVGASESGLANEQVVNIGKALTEKIMLGYEQSLTGAASIAKLTWQFSKRWSLVVRGGAINGVNALFSKRYD